MVLHNNHHHPPPALKTSIILPTYKERDNIVELVQAIHHHLEPGGFHYEVVVVDDNSPDGTAEVVRTDFGGDERVKLHIRTRERGLASALRYGAEHSDGDVLVFMDTDFNHDPAMIPQLIKFLEYYDVVIGSRFVMRGGMEDRVDAEERRQLIYQFERAAPPHGHRERVHRHLKVSTSRMLPGRRTSRAP